MCFGLGFFVSFVLHILRANTFETAVVLQSDSVLCKMHLMAGWLMKLLVGLDLCDTT